MTQTAILYEQPAPHVARILLNRPEARNAQDTRLLYALNDAFDRAAQDPDDHRPALTGRMTARVIDPPRVGERCAVVGWKIGEDGRKLYSGTALYTETGRLCAIGACTWIVLRS